MSGNKKKFTAARREALKELPAAVRQTQKEIQDLLKTAEKKVRDELSAAPSEYQEWYLSRVQKNIESVANELGRDLSAAGAGGFERAVSGGIGLIDRPVKAAFQYDLNAVLPQIDRGQLNTVKTFMTDRLNDIGAEAGKKIREQLGLCLIGAQNPFQAAREIAGHLDKNSLSRAKRITNTELGRAFSMATQERLEQAKDAGLKMKKQWRRSGKIHSRLTHDLADGQVVDADKPFTVGGVKMMYPRDPTAPVSETINCGCVCLPYMDDWEVEHPSDVPFTAEELNKSPEKRIVQDIRREDFYDWAEKILNRAADVRTDGTSKTAGTISADILQALKVRGLEPASPDISITDKQLIHLSRSVKKERGQQVDLNTIKNLPDLLNKADVVLRSKNKNELVYAFKRPDGLYDKVAVNLGRAEDGAKNAKRRNWIITAGRVSSENLQDKIYELLKGGF